MVGVGAVVVSLALVLIVAGAGLLSVVAPELVWGGRGGTPRRWVSKRRLRRRRKKAKGKLKRRGSADEDLTEIAAIEEGALSVNSKGQRYYTEKIKFHSDEEEEPREMKEESLQAFARGATPVVGFATVMNATSRFFGHGGGEEIEREDRKGIRFKDDDNFDDEEEEEEEEEYDDDEEDDSLSSLSQGSSTKTRRNFGNFFSGAAKGLEGIIAAPALLGSAALDSAQNLTRRRRLAEEPGNEGPSMGMESDVEEIKEAKVRRKPSTPALGRRFQDQVKRHNLLKHTMKPHKDLTTAVAISPSSQYVATAGGDADNIVRLTLRSTLGLSDALHRSQTLTLPVDDWVSALEFSTNSFFLVVGTGDFAFVIVYRVYRKPTTKPSVECFFETNHAGPVRHLHMEPTDAVDSNAHFMMTASCDEDRTLKFWSFAKKPKLIHKNDLSERFKEIKHVSYSAKGRIVGVAGNEDSIEGCSVAFFQLTFANRGALRKIWTVNGMELMRALVSGGADISFGSRSLVFATIVDSKWKLMRISKDHRIFRLAEFNGVEPFDVVALSETQKVLIASRGGDLMFYKFPEGGSKPVLSETIKNAHDSVIRRIIVTPEEDAILTLGANSRSAREWKIDF